MKWGLWTGYRRSRGQLWLVLVASGGGGGLADFETSINCMRVCMCLCVCMSVCTKLFSKSIVPKSFG